MMYSIGGETQQLAYYYSIQGTVEEEEEQIALASELLQETEEVKVVGWQAAFLEGTRTYLAGRMEQGWMGMVGL